MSTRPFWLHDLDSARLERRLRQSPSNELHPMTTMSELNEEDTQLTLRLSPDRRQICERRAFSGGGRRLDDPRL